MQKFSIEKSDDYQALFNDTIIYNESFKTLENTNTKPEPQGND